MNSKTIFSKIILILSFFIIGYIKAQGPAFNYAKQIGSSGDDAGSNIVTDINGNVYVSGWFSNTIDMDPSPSVFNLTSFGVLDIFVAKYDNNGNFIWAKQFGGASDDLPTSLFLDNNSDIIVSGTFIGTCDFDPSISVFNLSSSGGTQEDAFFMKLDQSGNLIWVQQIGSTDPDYSYSSSKDASNNYYFTGRFRGTVDFDPGAMTYTLNSSYQQAYILKLNSNGNFLWAKTFAGNLGSRGNSISIDYYKNVITTGYFIGITDFDPGIGTYNLNAIGQNDVYVSKLDSLGNFIWAKNFSGTADEEGSCVITDLNGNVYTSGIFQNTVDFDPGSSVYPLSTSNLRSTYLSKLDAQGNFQWAKHIGNGTQERPYSITFDNSYNLYLAGMFAGTTDFDPSLSTYTISSISGDNDIFVAKFDTVGNFNWVKSMQGSMDDKAYAVTLDNSGSVYLTGSFNGTVDFDPSASSYTLTNPSITGIPDAFIVKLSCQTPTINATASSSAICNGSSLTLNASGASTYTWNPGNLNGTSVTVSPTSNTTYTVTGIDVNGCSNSATKLVTVNSVPTLTASISSSVICNGNSSILSVSGASTYTWNPGNLSGSSVTVTPSSNTTYSVIGVDVNGCSNTSTKSVTVNSVPTLTTSSSSTSICNGANVTLSVSGASTYTWNPGNLSGSSVTVSPTSNTAYTVTGIDVNGCSNTSIKSITVNPIPTLTTTSSSTSICSGGNVTLSVSGASTYTWNPGNLSGTSVTVNPTSNTTYSVIGVDANGCSNSVIKSVTVNSAPVMTASVTNVNCNGNANGSIIVNVSGGTLPYSYLWSNGNITSQSNTLTAGSYSIQVSDLNNCSTNTVIILTEPSQITANVSVITPSCIGTSDGSAQLNVSGGISPYSILWSNGVSSTQNNNLSAGSYSVSISDASSCTITLSVLISDAVTSCFFVPNGFSPNGDGINDTWEIVGISNYPNAQVTVLNRWGQEMLNTNNYSTPWDGSFKGGLLPTSDYYYIINLNDGSKPLTGTLTIKR